MWLDSCGESCKSQSLWWALVAGADALAVLCAHGAPGARRRLLAWTLSAHAREMPRKRFPFVLLFTCMHEKSSSSSSTSTMSLVSWKDFARSPSACIAWRPEPRSLHPALRECQSSTLGSSTFMHKATSTRVSEPSRVLTSLATVNVRAQGSRLIRVPFSQGHHAARAR